MRTVAAILFSIISLSLGAQNEYPNILERDSFSGVKSLEITGYLLQLGENNDTLLIPVMQCGFTFNEKGVWTTKGGVLPDGRTTFDSIWIDTKTHAKYIRSHNDYESSLTTITYNTKGKVVTELYAPEQHESVMKEYRYDRSGKVIWKSETFGDQETVDMYSYDKKGRMISRKQSTGSVAGNTNKLALASVYEYNSIGKMDRTISCFYDALGVVNRRDTTWYEYDALKRLVLQKESRENGASSATTTWGYDEAGRPTLRVYKYNDLDGNYDEVTTTAVYDEYGYCKQFSDNGSGYGSGLNWNTTYNEKGFPVYCVYTTDPEVIVYKWEYVYR